jgi:hypothetical protein
MVFFRKNKHWLRWHERDFFPEIELVFHRPHQEICEHLCATVPIFFAGICRQSSLADIRKWRINTLKQRTWDFVSENQQARHCKIAKRCLAVVWCRSEWPRAASQGHSFGNYWRCAARTNVEWFPKRDLAYWITHLLHCQKNGIH